MLVSVFRLLLSTLTLQLPLDMRKPLEAPVASRAHDAMLATHFHALALLQMMTDCMSYVRDVSDLQWLKLLPWASHVVCTMFSPFPPWSRASYKNGLHDLAGWSFVDAIALLRLVRPAVIVLKNDTGCEHPRFHCILDCLAWAGFRFGRESIEDLKDIAPVARKRWLDVFIPCATPHHKFPNHCFAPLPSCSIGSFKTLIGLREQHELALTLDEGLIAVYSTPVVLKNGELWITRTASFDAAQDAATKLLDLTFLTDDASPLQVKEDMRDVAPTLADHGMHLTFHSPCDRGKSLCEKGMVWINCKARYTVDAMKRELLGPLAFMPVMAWNLALWPVNPCFATDREICFFLAIDLTGDSP
eukprot:s3310_g5.t1